MPCATNAQDILNSEKRAELDTEAEKYWSSFIGCLRPALRAAGTDISLDFLAGFVGSAFAFSMKEDGGKLVQADNYEWSYFWKQIQPLSEQISANKSSDPRWREKHDAAKKDAWNRVRVAIDAGYPAVVWQPMTKETKSSKKRPIPFLWGLIVGYDENSQSYIVHHSVCGKFTIRWDAFGHSDGANWFCVMIFKPQSGSYNITSNSQEVLTRAIASSEGEYPGVSAPAQGLAAWDMWLKAFNDGTVSTKDIIRHTTFLTKARSASAVYLRTIKPHFPTNSGNHLDRAANAYEEVVHEMKMLQDICDANKPDIQLGSQILAKAIKSEKIAIHSIKQALATQ
jgi:hypothetical protein